MIIAVHKWGQVEKYSTTRTELIIEDSVDSLCTSPSTLFPNDGTYEIFSLPKIIGSYSGGLIVTKHEELAREIRNLRCDREELSLHQARLRLDSAWKRQGQFQDWSHLEYQNTMLEVNSLRNITACLNNFEINRDTIRMRLDQIMHEKELEVMLSGDPDRLPPVACVPRSSVDLRDEDLEKFMVRHKNVSGRLDRPQFEKVILLPLHFGVSDERFKEFYKTLVTSRSK